MDNNENNINNEDNKIDNKENNNLDNKESSVSEDNSINIEGSDKKPKSEKHKKNKKKKKKMNLIGLNMILLVVIIIVFAASALKLGLWNIGEKVTSDSTTDSTEYNVEILDQVFLPQTSDTEGHEDDGVETILFLGNDAIADDTSDTGIAGKIAAKTGATVYTAAFPSSTVAIKNSTFDPTYPLDMFSFFYLSQFIAQDDFSTLQQQASLMDDDKYVTAADTLAGIDFNSIDKLVIMYDAQDYINGTTCYDPDNDVNPQTYTGAYDYGIKAIHEKYPFIRIIVMSHTFALTTDSNGNVLDADREDLGNGQLSTYLIKLIDVCEDCGVTFIDNYYGTIDADNYEDYLVDNTHLNDAAREHIANHFVSVVFPEAVSASDSSSTG